MNSLIRWTAAALGFVGALEGWMRFIWPPLGAYLGTKKPNLLSLVVDLLQPISPIHPDVPFYGYLLFLAGFIIIAFISGAMRAFFYYLEQSFVPITILKTELELTFEEQDLSIARLNRTQLYFANRSNITAYHLTRNVEQPGASISKEVFRCTSTIGQRSINEGEALMFGGDKKVEIVEKFREALPTSILASLLPNNIVLFLYEAGFFQRLVVKRNFHSVDMGEYNGKTAKFGLTSLRYPVTNIAIAINFPIKSEPEEIKFLHVLENTAFDIVPDFNYTTGVARYFINLRKFGHSSIYVLWDNIPKTQPTARGAGDGSNRKTEVGNKMKNGRRNDPSSVIIS